KIKPGIESRRLVALTDLLATFAELVGRPLPDDAGEDSISFLSVLDGGDHVSHRRTSLINDSMMGLFSIREGAWKLILGQGGGGHYQKEISAPGVDSAAPPGQLYNLDEDLAESQNRYQEHPEIVAHLTAIFERIQRTGRSR